MEKSFIINGLLIEKDNDIRFESFNVWCIKMALLHSKEYTDKSRFIY